MKSAILYGPSQVRIEEVGVPEIGMDEVLVRVDTALTCGTDVKVFLRGGHPRMITPPAPFGHEFAGIIEDIGCAVKTFRKGMRVTAANSAPCTKCFYCKRGKQNLCDDLMFINGAYSEFIRIPGRIVEQNLLPLPEDVPFSSAALVEPLACVLHGLQESGSNAGDTVVINGAGPIGLLFIQVAKLEGKRVISSETDENRRHLAAGAGADYVFDPGACDVADMVRGITGGRGADAGIEVVGSPRVWELTAQMVRKGGNVVFFGGCAPGTKIELDTGLIHYSELTLKGIFHHTPFFVEKALEIISRGLIDASCVITGERPLRELPRALEMMLKRSSAKIAIKPQI